MTDNRPEGEELSDADLAWIIPASSRNAASEDIAMMRLAIAAHEARKVQAEPVAVVDRFRSNGEWVLEWADGSEAHIGMALYAAPAPAAEDDKRDAERYRKLRDVGGCSWIGYAPGEDPKKSNGILITGALYDAAVDALQPTKEPSHE